MTRRTAFVSGTVFASRTAFVTTSFPEHEGDAAGHFVFAEARALADAGHDVHVVCPGHGHGPATFGSITVHRCGGGDAFGWPGVATRLRTQPWRALNALRFAHAAQRTLHDLDSGLRRSGAQGPALDEIRAHWLLPCAWPITSGTSARLHVTCHGGDVRLLCALPPPLRHRIIANVVRRADHISFAADRLRTQLIEALDAPLARRLERVSDVALPSLTVHIPTHVERHAARQMLCAGDDVRLVVVVGRLVPSKRIELAIDAVSSVHTPAKLIVVGDGPRREALERYAAESRGSVRFVGRQNRPTAHRLIAACDVLLHTSKAEAAPSVVREARLLGLPVLATSSGDIDRWAASDAYIVVGPPQADALGSAIDGLLQSSC